MLSLYLLDRTETNRWWLPFSQFSWTTQLNQGQTGTIDVPYQLVQELAQNSGQTVRQLFFDNWRKIIIYDDDNETTLFKGVLTDSNLSGASRGDLTLTLSFADPACLLSKRFTPASQTYTDTNLMTVAQALLTQAQTAGDLGLTLGTVDTTDVTVSRTYKSTRILDALVALSKNKIANGLEWQFNQDWQLDLRYPYLGSDKENIIFDNSNILSFQSQLGLLGSLVNRVNLKGANLSALATYTDQIAAGVWGVQEGYLSATDLSDADSLAERATQYLAETAFPFYSHNLTLTVLGTAPTWTSYQVGDRLRVRLPELDLDEMLRLTKRQLTYSNRTVQLTLTLSPQTATADFLQNYREVIRRLERLENN